MEKPLVSVLMTVYNRAAYIRDAITSVLASTYSHFELIIVDDCSTDDSLRIAYEIAATDNRITVYANEKNLTDYPNRNRAASYAKGKYIKYLDSDDTIYPYGLEIMVARMEQFPEAALGLSNWGLPDKPFPILLTPEELYRWSFLENRFIFTNAPSSTIILRSAFEDCHGFSGLNQVGDLEFWMKVARRYPVVLMEAGTNWARDHKDSEKYKDSLEVKAKMAFDLCIAALHAEDNPLSIHDKKRAIEKLQTDFKRNKFRGRIKKITSSFFPFR